MLKKLIFLLVTVFGLFLVSCDNTKVDSISISGDTLGVVGEVINLEVVILPKDADDKKVTWESSAEELATVIDVK